MSFAHRPRASSLVAGGSEAVAPGVAAAAARDVAVDFAKGALVCAMVLYHTMNYFSTAEAVYYGYLRFVNGAFIFLSGYIAAAFHESRRTSEASLRRHRLLIRGLKLLLLFSVLNALISVFG
jgi:uncharacterized membrane protein